MSRKGFTLVELLVVIAIISLLISILAPSLNVAKDIAKQIQCSANMNAASKGMMMYCESNSDKWTPYWMGISKGKAYVKKVMQCAENSFWASKEGDLDPIWLTQIYRGVGIMYNTGFIESPHYFYCPAQKAPSMSIDQYLFDETTGQQTAWGTNDPSTNMIRMGLLFNAWGKHYDDIPVADAFGNKNDMAARSLSAMESDKAMIIDNMIFPWITAVHTAKGVNNPTFNVCGPDGSVTSYSSSVMQELLIQNWGGVLKIWLDNPDDYNDWADVYTLLRTGA